MVSGLWFQVLGFGFVFNCCIKLVKTFVVRCIGIHILGDCWENPHPNPLRRRRSLE